MKRIAIPSSAVLLFTFMFATPVLAAAPTNDDFAGATVIAGLPYNETLDTSEATSEPSDAELNTVCGAPALDASVWYEFTPSADMGVLVDVSESDYSAGVFVATGSPGAFGPVEACGPGFVTFFATAGTTYVLMIIDDQQDGGGNGGSLVINVTELPPPPEIDVNVNPVGTFNAQTGSVTLTGTVTCTDGAFAFIDIQLTQSVGRFTVRGFGFVEMACDGTAQPWTAEISATPACSRVGTPWPQRSARRAMSSTAGSPSKRRPSACDGRLTRGPTDRRPSQATDPPASATDQAGRLYSLTCASPTSSQAGTSSATMAIGSARSRRSVSIT